MRKQHEALDGGETPSHSARLGEFGETFSVKLLQVSFQFQRELARSGLDSRSGVLACLAAIVVNPGSSQNDLSFLIGKDKSIIVNLIHKLEEEGWAFRKSSETDRRRHEIYATPVGEAVLANAVATMTKVEAKLLSGMPRDAIATLRQLLRAARASCDAGSRANGTGASE